MMESPVSFNNIAELSEAENELYDRQIRLWGIESQKRLRSAKILISGLNGIGAEITKNIILSGVNMVKLHDDKPVTEEDFCSQFLVSRKSLGRNRAEESVERAKSLNPMVEISTDIEALEHKDESFFKTFDVVIILGASNKEILRINQICRKNNVKFFTGDVWGMFGYGFTDLQEHEFIEDIMKHKIVSQAEGKIKTELVTTTLQRKVSFPPFSKVLEMDLPSQPSNQLKRGSPSIMLLRVLQTFREKYKRDPQYQSRVYDIKLLQNLSHEIFNDINIPESYFELIFGQISPVSAIVGGILAQEIIKAVTKKEAPNLNVFLFDPLKTCGFIETFV